MNLEQYGLTEKELSRLLAGRTNKPAVIKKHITNDEFEFGIVSDTHFGSNYECLDELHTIYEVFKKCGITEVVHAGDILSGQRMYPGWEMETKAFGSLNQVAHCVKNYPKVKGIKTYFITGSHDTCYFKQNGTEVGELIAQAREDLVYIGQYAGTVEINGIKIQLLHPTGGVPYALSYRGQKIVEQIPSGGKPHILVIGHLHICYYFNYRNVHVIGAGCFQSQTPYLLQKGLNPQIGGWTVKIRRAKYKKQSVVAITPSWIPFL